MSFDLYDYSQKFSQLVEDGFPFVVITMVAIRGSAPQVIGAKATVTAEGLTAGTIGGGKIEAAAIKHAQGLLNQHDVNCDFVTWNLQTEIGMTCGGEVKLLFERFASSPFHLAVFGAGHIAQSLIPTLLTLNCRITCVDSRHDWLERLPSHRKLSTICTDDMAETAVAQPAGTFFVLMTRGHATDLPILAAVLKTRQPPFIGVIGSVQKAKVLRRDLRNQGLSDDKVDSFHCPLGIPIGNNTPPEISISITAQLLQARDQVDLQCISQQQGEAPPNATAPCDINPRSDSTSNSVP